MPGHAAHSLPDARSVSNVAFDERKQGTSALLNQRFYIFALACAEIIQHADRVAAREQSLRNVRADETRAAGD
jgi:hypothetical protein